MTTDDAEDLVPFQDVRVIGSTAPAALLCLPRGYLRSPLPVHLHLVRGDPTFVMPIGGSACRAERPPELVKVN